MGKKKAQVESAPKKGAKKVGNKGSRTRIHAMVRAEMAPTESGDKRAMVKAAVAALRGKYGVEVVATLDGGPLIDVQKTGVIPTGSVSLDLATGVGGYPRGRVVEIFGPAAAGKSTLALHACVEAQRLGGVVAYIDAENAMDLAYAKALGVDTHPDRFAFIQPNSGEQGLDIVEALARSGFDLVVIDSVAALTPQAELDASIEENQMGLHARLMSKSMRRLTSAFRDGRSVGLFINQLRMKIGVVYGSPEVTTGGAALKYAASLRIDVRARQQVKDPEGRAVGNEVHVKIVKNKVAVPFREADFDIIWGAGVDASGDIINACVTLGIIAKTGAWYLYGDVRLGHGLVNAIQALNADPELRDELAGKVKAQDAQRLQKI